MDIKGRKINKNDVEKNFKHFFIISWLKTEKLKNPMNYQASEYNVSEQSEKGNREALWSCNKVTVKLFHSNNNYNYKFIYKTVTS